MIPFVRTRKEAEAVIDILASFGLKRGEHGLRLIMMCEVPSNAILAEEFLQYFDGFSIGSNDLTQLTLGVDRDSGLLASSFDERDPAVGALLKNAINTANRMQKYIDRKSVVSGRRRSVRVELGGRRSTKINH